MHQLIIACAVLAALGSAEYVSAQLAMDQLVVGTSGGRMSNGALVLDYTIGEPIVGPAANGPMEADLGFWWAVFTANVAVGDLPLPERFALTPGAPNPFTTRTEISYAVPTGEAVPVFLGVYDLKGALVKTLVRGTRTPGMYHETWDGRSDGGDLVATGVYLVAVRAGSFKAARKVVMLR